MYFTRFKNLFGCCVVAVCFSAAAQTQSPGANVAQGTNATCQAAPPAVPPLYLRGSMNGWTAQEDFEFVWDCNAFYLNINLQGQHEFKLADAKWQTSSSWSVPDRKVVSALNALALMPDKPNGPSTKLTFSGAHTLRLSLSSSHALLQLLPQTFADPRKAAITHPVALSVHHDSRDLIYRNPFGAVPQNQNLTWGLKALPGIESATLVLDVRRLEGNQEILEYRNLARIKMQRTSSGTHDMFHASYVFQDKAIYGYWFEVIIDEIGRAHV